jgi:hypothetical protein
LRGSPAPDLPVLSARPAGSRRAVRRGEERSSSGECHDLPHTRSAGAAADAEHQRAARPSGEYGLITGQGIGQVSKLIDMIENPVCVLPEAARSMLKVLSGMIAVLDEQVKLLDSEIARRAKTEDVPRRLMIIPGVGPITATALAALAPPPEVFRMGRDFAAPALRNAKRSFCARANALAKINRRQTEAGGHLEDGRANLAAAADHRGQCRRLSGHKARGTAGFMAGTDVGTQAKDAGHHGACQQDCADRLGADGEERDL